MLVKLSKSFFIFSAFVIVLIISIAVHLPLGWLLDQPQIKQQIPKNITLSQPQGTWWNGQFHVKLNTPTEKIELGEIAYKISWTDLLFADLAADISWLVAGKSADKLTAQVNVDGELLKVTNLSGDVAVSSLMQLSEKTAILADAGGELHLLDLSFELPIKEAWPTKMTGKLTITQFSAMGMELGLLEAVPSVQGQEIQTNITGGQQSKGWELKANTVLFKNNRYQYDVKVTATNPNNMPDWVALMLPMKNPRLAKLSQSGRW